MSHARSGTALKHMRLCCILLCRHPPQVSGIIPEALKPIKPLIVLNDKRYTSHGQVMEDRRMILDIDALADSIQEAYPFANVMVVAFRDYTLTDQMRFLAGAKVFITTAGSSSHMLVFMPRGSTTIMLGGPEDDEAKAAPWGPYTSFNELDRWLPLSYVDIQRYETNVRDKEWFEVKRNPDIVATSWQPPNPQVNARWWQYNADIRVDMQRLRPMLDRALGRQ